MFANSFNSLHSCIPQHPLQRLLHCEGDVSACLVGSCKNKISPNAAAFLASLFICLGFVWLVSFFVCLGCFLAGSKNGSILNDFLLVELENCT